MARETLPAAVELTFGDPLQPSLSRSVLVIGARRRRSAMRPVERVKVIEWTAALAAVAFVASLIMALLP